MAPAPHCCVVTLPFELLMTYHIPVEARQTAMSVLPSVSKSDFTTKPPSTKIDPARRGSCRDDDGRAAGHRAGRGALTGVVKLVGVARRNVLERPRIVGAGRQASSRVRSRETRDAALREHAGGCVDLNRDVRKQRPSSLVRDGPGHPSGT